MLSEIHVFKYTKGQFLEFGLFKALTSAARWSALVPDAILIHAIYCLRWLAVYVLGALELYRRNIGVVVRWFYRVNESRGYCWLT